MDKVEFFDDVGGKRVGVVFIFDSYKERHFNKDVKDFIEYQLHKVKADPKTLDLKFYLDMRNFKVEDFKRLNYKLFRDYVPQLFSKIYFYMLRQNPKFIIADPLILQFRLMRVSGRKWYFEYMEKISDPSNARFKAAGTWFIQTILAPHAYSKHVDASIILRYFSHELGHHLDYMNKEFRMWDMQFEHNPGGETRSFSYEGKIKRLARRSFNQSLNFLYLSMFNLREEGLQDFRARVNSDKVEMSMKGIRIPLSTSLLTGGVH